MRFPSARGWSALTLDTRRRILGAPAAAFKCGRLDTRWGRRMLARRGARARLRSIAMASEQRWPYFADLGRLGGRRPSVGWPPRTPTCCRYFGPGVSLLGTGWRCSLGC
jgi:hypothetical protein